jgi:hypothetical protein
MPKDVHDLQGDGTIWQDYRVFLRFRTSSETIDQLIKTGYSLSDSNTNESQFKLPEDYKGSFRPAWSPQFDDQSECYVKETASTSHCLLVNRRSGEVHFVGSSR